MCRSCPVADVVGACNSAECGARIDWVVEIDVVVVVGAIELALGDGHSNEPRRGIENGFSLDASSAIFSDQASGFHPKLSARMWALLSDTLSFPIGGQRPVGIDGGHLWHDQCGEMLGQG